MNRLTLRASAAFLALLVAGTAIAGEMYRYYDEDGSPVITTTLPSEVAERGYQVLNSSGRVIEEVDPAPTAEEIAERELQAALERQRQEAEEAQQRQDRRLMRQYSHPDDTVRHLQRQLREMYSLIRLKQGNITNLENQIAQEESRAANFERRGDDVPDRVKDRIARLERQKADIEDDIRGQLDDINTLRNDFRARIERMEEITGNERTLPLTIPEEEQFQEESDLQASSTE